MAITAKFIADFASFYAAVEKAEAQLIDLSKGADRAGTRLDRMVDGFSGRKVVQDATLMAEAVERIGGVSKLTEKELQQVGRSAADATAKLLAMGKEVPPGLQKINDHMKTLTERQQALEKEAAIKKMADETKRLEAQQSSLVGTLKSVAGAFGIAFSAQQLVGFIGKVFNAADAIKDMAERLDISFEAAQRFDYAAKQTGTTMETVEKAIFNMTRSLATGDKSTVRALQDVGQQFERIRGLQPEEAFTVIADAIGQIPDPMRQAQVATELFGKSALQLLPAIREGFVSIGKQAPIMSDETVRALEAAKQAWENFGNAVIVHSGNMIAALGALPNIFKDVATSSQNIAVFLENVRKGGIGFAIAMAGVTKEAKAANVELKPMPTIIGQTAQELKEAEDAAKKFAEQQRKSVEALREFKNFIGIREMEDYAAAQKAAAEHIAENVRLELAMGIMYQENAKKLGAYAENVGLFAMGWKQFNIIVPSVVKNITNSGKALQSAFGNFFKKGLSDLFGGATSVGQGITNVLKNIGTGLFEAIGSGLTSLIGKGIGLLGKGLGKLFGFGDTEKKKVDEMRQAFIDQIGGWHELNKAAQKTGLTLDKVLNAKKVKDYEAAIGELKRRLELQETAWNKVQAAIERYGFTIEQLGPALQKQKLSENALQLYEDFQLLVAAGIDIETVLTQMSGKINDFVHLAIKMGFQVDLSMKPMLQKMVEMGLLTDENGELITDLEESGINFSQSITEAFAEVADSLREMIDLLKLFLGLTEQIPTTVPGAGNGGYPGPTPSPPLPPDIPDVASLVANSIARGEHGESFNHLLGEVRLLRADLMRQQRVLPKQLRDAMLLAA